MDIGRFFSRKDFFNYYVAGVMWLIDFAILVTFFPSQLDLRASLSAVTSLSEAVVLGILAVVMPYAVGFTLSPMGGLLSNELHERFGDPTKWMTVHKGPDKYAGRRIPKPAVRQIDQLAHNTFGYELHDKTLWFYYLRAYVEQKGGAASELATRAKDLANLTESLLLPMPLFFALSSLRVISNLYIAVLVSAVSFLGVLTLLSYRYMKLREYWVQHVYRGFLVLEAKRKHAQVATPQKADE